MNPERVQLFRIRYVIGRSKTRTGFENHMLSHTRGRLVPRQPRAFKSTTRTELAVLPAFKKQIMSGILVQCHTTLAPNRTISRRNLWKIISIIRVIQHHKRITWHRNSVRVVLLIAPRWRMKWAYVGNKWTHGMNPIWVQLFRIRHVIGRSKTRTGFENHLLSHTRGRLVPRQPRAFKSTTRTELIVFHAFKKRHNIHHHRIITDYP